MRSTVCDAPLSSRSGDQWHGDENEAAVPGAAPRLCSRGAAELSLESHCDVWTLFPFSSSKEDLAQGTRDAVHRCK